MNGSIIGDIVGSVYEFNTIKQKNFKFLKDRCFFTDDTVMSCAVAKAAIEYLDNKSIPLFKINVINNMVEFGRKHPDAGYGYYFYNWIMSDNHDPYNSFGNGSAMRTSSVAYIAESLEEAEELAKAQAEVTHNHPEGIKGAQAIAAAIYLALNKKDKSTIKEYIENNYYDLDFNIKDIYRKYKYDVTCQGSVPYAIKSFLEGEDFEDSIRNSISLGGDADTLACMTGAIAEAYYGIPEEILEQKNKYLTEDLIDIVDNFQEKVQNLNKNIEKKDIFKK